MSRAADTRPHPSTPATFPHDIRQLRALIPGLLPAPDLDTPPGSDNDLFCLAAFRSKLVEISSPAAHGALTVAVHLTLEAQLAGENAAWIAARTGFFFPPDASACGIDLDALPVVAAPDPLAAGRAASHLLRSEAFGLIVLDLGSPARGGPSLPQPLLSRLVGLAQKAGTALVILTDKTPGDESLGSIVGLHLFARRTPAGTSPDGQPLFRLTLEAAKDKRRGPGWHEQRTLLAPPDLE